MRGAGIGVVGCKFMLAINPPLVCLLRGAKIGDAGFSVTAAGGGGAPEQEFFLGGRRHPSGSLTLDFAWGSCDGVVRSCRCCCCESVCDADDSPKGFGEAGGACC